MKARLIVEPTPLDGLTAMRRDLEALTATQTDGLVRARLYEWDGVWVSLGRNQRAEDALIADVPWVERPTGGKAVLHGHDVTVSFAVPVDARPDLHALYRTITAWIIGALEPLGLEAKVGNTVTDTSTADCFADTGRFDLTTPDGRKIGGCAMRVLRHGALLQASLPYRAPKVPHSALIRGGSDHPVLEWCHEALPQTLARVLKIRA